MGAIAVVHGMNGPPPPGAVDRMLEAVPHRGDQTAVVAVGRTVLGCVNDPDFVTASVARRGGWAVAHAGSLDNKAELDADLRAVGIRPGSNPADTIAALFLIGGEGAVDRLRGAFAGVASDGTTAWSFREPFGGQPLYRRERSGVFYAATEIKQVLAGTGLARTPDLEHLERMLFGGIETSTAVTGVERVPRGTIGPAGPTGVGAFRSWWDPQSFVETSDLGYEDACEGLREALRTATLRSLRGRDVVLLSGGLDSTAIAAFAGPAGASAYTAVYPDHPSVDESHWTKMMAEHVEMPLHMHVPSASSLDDLETWVDRLDGPIDVMSIPEAAEAYRVARQTLGGRVVIGGEIAEFVLECRRYLIDHLISRGRLGPAARQMVSRKRMGWGWRSMALQLGRTFTPPPLLEAYHQRHLAGRVRGPVWIDREMQAAGGRGGKTILSRSPRNRWRQMQTSPFKGPGIAFEMDEICGAHCGVEVRRPFADMDLWRFLLSLRAEVKFGDARVKGILRDSMRGLVPDPILDRTDKTYFDEYHLDKADYGTLKRFCVEPEHRMPGVDYDLLRDQIESGRMSIADLQWARDLARIHAFLRVC